MDSHWLSCGLLGVMLSMVVSSLIFGFMMQFDLLEWLLPLQGEFELWGVLMMVACALVIYFLCGYGDKYQVANEVFEGLDKHQFRKAKIKYISTVVLSAMFLAGFGWFMPLLLR
ncbi:hypothetical protein [Lacimicrobium sp. SS2-24]|uniref:hypothetical protein n=1 Tax=Lacimicrobium sp. SS2-24 TaxID=2005569 RepID=UPI000B4AC591|nr:hypothetical protein [Lacimicrobium sp. SS2-24]